MKSDFLKLMLITDRKDIAISEYCKFIKICADSGITSLQLREKGVSEDTLLKNGEYIKRVLEPYKIPLIINDNMNVAKQLDADGVHLGQDDGDPKVARDLLGPDKIIGLSVDSKEELYIANQLDINYIGIGAIFKTKSKNNVKKYVRIDELRILTKMSLYDVVGIGGIKELNILDVMATSVKGVAVISAIHEAVDTAFTVKKLRKLIDSK